MTEKTKQYGITQSGIDALGYYVGNYALHDVSADLPKADLKHTVVYFISDLAIRNKYVTMWSDYENFKGGEGGKNAYIAVIAFLANTAVDVLSSKKLGEAAMKNALRSAVGFGVNTIVDKFVLSEEYQ